MSPRRGHALALVMMVLFAFSAAGLVVHQRLMMDVQERVDDGVRRQATWLARSAGEAGFQGRRTVETAYGTASVFGGATVRVELAGAVATWTAGELRFQAL